MARYYGGDLYKPCCFKKNFIQKNIPDSSAQGEGAYRRLASF